MTTRPDPKKTDSLGRNRLPSERYSQSGGNCQAKHIVWTCKKCSRAWNVTSRSYRYDSKCRQCGTRNSILMTRPQSFYPGRKRVTKFQYFPSAEDAAWNAKKRNVNWMKRRTKKGYGKVSFVKASWLNLKRDEIWILEHPDLDQEE